MRPRHLAILAAAALAAGGLAAMLARAQEAAPAGAEEARLAVLWSSGDADVAHRVCFMYTHAAGRNRWFDQVRLIVWGPSARLLAGDKDLQAKVKAMMGDGVKVQACIACANSYGVTQRLRELGIEVKGMGKPLTELIRGGWKVLTF